MSTELLVIEDLNPVEVFAQGLDPLIGKIEAEARAVSLDISTDKGRKEVASLAYKIAKSKTALDEMGKKLTEEWKAKCKGVDEERKKARDRLDALKAEIRLPLTQWEEKEEERIAKHIAALEEFSTITVFMTDPTLAEVEERIAKCEFLIERDFQEFEARASKASADALEFLTNKYAAREKYYAEQEELARLRREAEERAQQDRDKAIAEAAAKAEAERLEKKHAAEKAEAEKEKRDAEEREHKAIKEKEAAEKKARDAEEAIERKKREDIVAAEHARLEKEREHKAAKEREAKAAEEATKREKERAEQEAAKERKLAAEREANKQHRIKINNETLNALLPASGISIEQGKAVVEAIARGKIPHVTIKY